ncbi:MAG: nucleotidyltransferase [Lachnospiraceae bacterium]|nr:nucleotidyltransferase [Lachnospiraceae bacterium]
MKTSLVVMAAGMGSRFGGLKQMEPVGKNGEVLLDYSIYDAMKSGFDEVVFIIKKEIEHDFREIVGKKIEKKTDVKYVMQTCDNLPEGRKKPWGTAHAILCCKDAVTNPFVALNADDYYGSNAFGDIHNHLLTAGPTDFSMVAYMLKNTVSENGTVARGVCEIENGYMRKIVERTKIRSDLSFTEDGGETWTALPENTLVSMNLWGLTPAIFPVLEEKYEYFLKNANLLKDEFLIPTVIGELVTAGKATVRAFPNRDKWYGMTYREDKEEVKRALAALTEEGLYDGI